MNAATTAPRRSNTATTSFHEDAPSGAGCDRSETVRHDPRAGSCDLTRPTRSAGRRRLADEGGRDGGRASAIGDTIGDPDRAKAAAGSEEPRQPCQTLFEARQPRQVPDV